MCWYQQKRKYSEVGERRLFNVDICINSAGLALGTDYVDVADETDWEKMLQVNVSSNFIIVKTVLPYMK